MISATHIDRMGAESQAHQIAMTQLYLFDAVELISKRGKEAIISSSEGDEQKMMLMGLKRYTKYSEFPNIVALRNQVAEKIAEENQYCF